MPRLLSEYFGRVEGILPRGGSVLITLVKCYEVESSELFLDDYISPNFAGLSKSYALGKFETFFSNDGLCIRAHGYPILYTADSRCCTRAF